MTKQIKLRNGDRVISMRHTDTKILTVMHQKGERVLIYEPEIRHSWYGFRNWFRKLPRRARK